MSFTSDIRGRLAIDDSVDSLAVVVVSAFGFRTKTLTIAPPHRATLTIDLVVLPFLLPVVSGDVSRGLGARMGVRLSNHELRAIPTALEADLFRAVQSAAGITPASDYNAGLYIAGTGPGSTSVVLNGLPLLNPYHLGGIFSSFDPEYVGSLELITGGVPAGTAHDGLGGALLIETRNGSKGPLKASISAGLVSSSGRMEGSLTRNSTFLVGVRRTYLDFVTGIGARLGVTAGTIPYSFTELFGQFSIGMRGVPVRAFAYRNSDRLDWTLEDSATPAPETTWSSWTGGIGVVGAKAGAWDIDGVIGAASSRGSTGYLSTLSDDLANTRHSIIRGLGAAGTQFQHGYVRLTGQVDIIRFGSVHSDGSPLLLAQRPLTMAAAAAEVTYPWRGMEGSAAARITHALGRADVRPRVTLRTTALRPELFAGIADYGARVYSARNEESFKAAFLAVEVPASTASPHTAREAYLGAAYGFRGYALKATLSQRRIRTYLETVGSDPLAGPLFIENGHTGTIDMRQVYASAKGQYGRIFTALAYTGQETISDVAGIKYWPRYSRPHSLAATIEGEIGSTTVARADIRWASGLPYSPPQGVVRPLEYDVSTKRFVWPVTDGNTRGILGDYNSARLPPYFRLDLSMRTQNHLSIFGVDGTLEWSAAIINATGARNVLAPKRVVASDVASQLELISQAPILPSLALTWRF